MIEKIIIGALLTGSLVLAIIMGKKTDNKIYEVNAIASLNRFDNLIHYESDEIIDLPTTENILNIKTGEKVKVVISYKLVDLGYDVVKEIIEVKKQ